MEKRFNYRTLAVPALLLAGGLVLAGCGEDQEAGKSAYDPSVAVAEAGQGTQTDQDPSVGTNPGTVEGHGQAGGPGGDGAAGGHGEQAEDPGVSTERGTDGEAGRDGGKGGNHAEESAAPSPAPESQADAGQPGEAGEKGESKDGFDIDLDVNGMFPDVSIPCQIFDVEGMLKALPEAATGPDGQPVIDVNVELPEAVNDVLNCGAEGSLFRIACEEPLVVAETSVEGHERFEYEGVPGCDPEATGKDFDKEAFEQRMREDIEGAFAEVRESAPQK